MRQCGLAADPLRLQRLGSCVQLPEETNIYVSFVDYKNAESQLRFTFFCLVLKMSSSTSSSAFVESYGKYPNPTLPPQTAKAES